MCGIAGVLQFNKAGIDKDSFVKMAAVKAHRGPDDEGYLFVKTKNTDLAIGGGETTPRYVYTADLCYTPKVLWNRLPGEAYDLAFASRRLAIFDLSAAGHQPMSNEDETIWITFNGAIYNYEELRKQLMRREHKFISNSDTEVIIKAYQQWGVECLSRFNGMWAFCIWDSAKKRIFCARDRFGIKPFYYYFDANMFAFASEIKSLLQLGIPLKANDVLIYDFLKLGILDHTDETFFNGVMKLSPSHYLTMDLGGSLVIRRYWDLEVSDEVESEFSDERHAEEFLGLFTDAVRLRLRSDVPVGSCLSGGLDSSSIVCVANNLLFPTGMISAKTRQKTFSSCFEDRRFDEREYIEEIVRKTQAENNYVFPSPEEFLRDLNKLIWHQDEPFGGTSIYAQWLVMKKARERGITVMLDGQGGDEQLGGYRKFYIFYLLKLWGSRRYGKLLWESLNFFSSLEILRTLNLRVGLGYFGPGIKLLGADNLFTESFKQGFKDRQIEFGYQHDLGQRIKADLFKFSLPVLLRYEDRNSMAHSIEARLPFLDYRLVEKLASFPLTQKMRNGWTKYVLRNAMKDILQEKVRLRRSKLGFDTPQDQWFKRSLRPVAKDVFQDSTFIPNYIDVKKLVDLFDKYSAGISLYQSQFFFRFFILELWSKRFMSSLRK